MREGLEEDGVSSQAGVEGQGAEPPGGAAPAAKAVGGAQNACTGAFGSSGLVGDDRLFPDEADTTPAYLRWG